MNKIKEEFIFIALIFCSLLIICVQVYCEQNTSEISIKDLEGRDLYYSNRVDFLKSETEKYYDSLIDSKYNDGDTVLFCDYTKAIPFAGDHVYFITKYEDSFETKYDTTYPSGFSMTIAACYDSRVYEYKAVVRKRNAIIHRR